MAIIYEPTGKAKEYCDLAANLYTGCSHGCLYCYAPACLRRSPEQFRTQVNPRTNILAQLEKEAPAFTGKEVHLCFTCDPYQPAEQVHEITRGTLEIFTRHGVRARILTKGGTSCLHDLDKFQANHSIVGATLTLLEEEQSRYWEPGAALPMDRINALRRLKESGIETWASLEPVIDPEQSLEIIRLTHKYVDTFKIGKWNHAKAAAAIDWADFAARAVALLDSLGCKYYIKDDLRKYLEAA
ncbi:MAG: radical SAM protein [Geobacteraceae bacterium]